MKKPLLLLLCLLMLLPAASQADLLTVQQDTTIYVISSAGTLTAAGTLPAGYQVTLDGVEAPSSGILRTYFNTTAQPVWYRAVFSRGSETMTGYLLANPEVVTGLNPNPGQNVLATAVPTASPTAQPAAQGWGSAVSAAVSSAYSSRVTYALSGTSDTVEVAWSREGLGIELAVGVNGSTAIEGWSMCTFTGQSLGTLLPVSGGWSGSAVAGELLVTPTLNGVKMLQWAFTVTSNGVKTTQARQVLTNANNDRLNFRSSPSRSSNAPAQLGGGTVVYVLDTTVNEGTVWDLVYWNGMFGYVDDSYLTTSGTVQQTAAQTAQDGVIAQKEMTAGVYRVTASLVQENGQYSVRIESVMTVWTEDDIAAWQVYLNNAYAGEAQLTGGNTYTYAIGSALPDTVILAPYARKSGIKTDQVIYLK